VAGRDAASGDAVVGAIRERGGRADFVGADLRDAQAVRRFARDALTQGGGRVDVLVNNAGIYPFGPTADTEESLFDTVYALNVKAPFYLVAELAPPMADRGDGSIVNVSTMAAVLGFEGMALYGSSKAALNLLTKAWAAEYGPRGVRVRRPGHAPGCGKTVTRPPTSTPGATGVPGPIAATTPVASTLAGTGVAAFPG
ncbi:SDR family NAD(P)-dependent oxidoreductase, partial [Streptomyces sp. 2MCAF27]